MRLVGTRGFFGNTVYVLHSWINKFPTEKRVRWRDESFPGAGVQGFCDSEGHVEPAVSVRLWWKTHEIQTEVHSESNSSLSVCPVVEDEMDEEDMDDKRNRRRRAEQ